MNYFKIYITLILFINSAYVNAQDNFVLTSISKNNLTQINIKWYSKDFIYPEGVNLYRKEISESNWTKINSQPIKKGNYTPTADELKQDKELKSYMEMVSSIAKLEGVPLLGAYVKSFKSQAFSKYIGIQFTDNTALPNTKVQYKACALKNGAEKEIGISTELLTGVATNLEPPKEITVDAKNKKSSIKWLPETNRYYAVDIYRGFDSTGIDRKKINKDPIIISKNKNKKGEYEYPEQFYFDEKLREDTTYYYAFKAIDFFGEESEFSPTLKVFVKDLNEPQPPMFISKTTKHKSVTIKWKKTIFEKDFVGYNLYRAQQSKADYTLVNKTLIPKTDSAYTDSVNRYGLFRYVIASIDKSGNEGVTEEIPIETIDEIPPAIPKGLVIIADTGRITLTWQANTETDLWGYMVYQAINKNVNNDAYVLITPNPITTNVFKQNLAKNSKNKFLYKVLALDSTYNKSELSNYAVTTLPDVTPPEPPFIKEVTQNDKKNIVIDFFKNTELDLMGYNLYRTYIEEEIEKTELVNAKIIDKTAIRYIDRDFENTGLVQYYLVAVDSTNNASKKSNTVKINIKKEEAVIDKPVFTMLNAKALKLPNSWQLKWKVENATDDVFYVVYTRQVGDVNFEAQTKNITDKKITLRLKNSINTYVQVRAYNAKGLLTKSEIKLLEHK